MKVRSNLAIFYSKDGQRKEDQEKLEAKAAYCTEQILKAKNSYILRMNNKFNNLSTDPKNWSILNRFLYSKNIATISFLFIDGKFVLDFCTKSNLSNELFVSKCAPKEMEVHCSHLRTNPKLKILPSK